MARAIRIAEHLWIIDIEISSFVEQTFANAYGRRFAGVSRIFLKRKSINGKNFVRYGMKHGFDDLLRETLLLVFIHRDNLEGKTK